LKVAGNVTISGVNPRCPSFERAAHVYGPGTRELLHDFDCARNRKHVPIKDHVSGWKGDLNAATLVSDFTKPQPLMQERGAAILGRDRVAGGGPTKGAFPVDWGLGDQARGGDHRAGGGGEDHARVERGGLGPE